MLSELFSRVLHMSLTASVVIAVVCLARLCLKGAPKIYSYLLWALVLFRLLCPVSLVTSYSLIPDPVSSGAILADWTDDYIGQTHTVFDSHPEFQTAVDAGRETFPAEEGHYYTVTGGDGISPPDTVENRLMPLLTGIWIAGILAMSLHSILSYVRIRKQTRVAVPLRKGVFLADDVTSPFVMGLFRPVIYLPGSLDPWERTFILAHERHHIRRGDHIFKALGFLALTIHWFNPLVWLAFVLSSRDMEMSCDEAVIRRLGEDVRADYSASLLNLATGHRLFTGTPLAFGEGDPTGRVRNLARWKKPKRWIILICVALCIVLAVCLLTDPENDFDWSTTRQEGPTSCALGDFNYTTPKGLAVQATKIDHSGNAADYGTEFYVGDTLVGGVIQRYQDSENGLEPFTREWEIALGIPEALDETMSYSGGSSSYADHEVTYFHDVPKNFDDIGEMVSEKKETVIHHYFLNGHEVYDLWFYTDRLGEAMQTALLKSAHIQPPTAVSDWGVSIIPERVSRTGATATFVWHTSHDAELTYGDFLALERYENGNWVPVEEQPGFEYFVGDSSYPVVDGYGMVHEWGVRFGELPDGHYRLGKQVTLTEPDGSKEEKIIYGEFFLPNSILTLPIPLEDLPEKYSGEQAMLDGCFVSADSAARENKDLFHSFVQSSWQGTPGFIRIVDWHYGDTSHYVAYDLNYDGSMYTLTWYEDGRLHSREFPYIRYFSGDDGNISYEHYVLVHDELIDRNLWGEAIRSHASTYSDHMTVYSNYTGLPTAPQLPEKPARAVLEFDGQALVSTTDFDRLEKIWILFQDAEFLGYEPKTHSVGVGLNLILTSQSGETVTVELDPDSDICRIDGEFVFYGAPDEPDYIEKLWYYLDIEAWPDPVYDACSNAYRP